MPVGTILCMHFSLFVLVEGVDSTGERENHTVSYFWYNRKAETTSLLSTFSSSVAPEYRKLLGRILGNVLRLTSVDGKNLLDESMIVCDLSRMLESSLVDARSLFPVVFLRKTKFSLTYSLESPKPDQHREGMCNLQARMPAIAFCSI